MTSTCISCKFYDSIDTCDLLHIAQESKREGAMFAFRFRVVEEEGKLRIKTLSKEGGELQECLGKALAKRERQNVKPARTDTDDLDKFYVVGDTQTLEKGAAEFFRKWAKKVQT